MRAHVIQNGRVVNTIVVHALSDLPGLIDAEQGGRIGDLWDGHNFTTPDEQPDPLAIQADGAVAVQRYLDEAAQAHGYDNIVSLCTYASSKNPKWAAEGQYGCDLRDACWSKAQQIQDAVMAGERALPSVAQVLAELPAIAWPAV